MTGSRHALLTSMLLLTAGLGAAAPTAPAGATRPDRAAGRVDAGDGYRCRDRWVPLERRSDQWAVSGDAAARLAADGVLEPVGASAPATGSVSRPRVMRRPSGLPGKAAEPAAELSALRARTAGSVDPVFVDPRSGVRLVTRRQIVVRLAAGLDPATLPVAMTAHRRLSGTPDQFVLHLRDATAEEELAAVTRLAATPGVLWAEPDFLKEWKRHRQLNDPLVPDQWHIENAGYTLDGAPYSPADVDVDAAAAWDRSFGTTNVVIAIIDDGVQGTHPDLQSRMFVHDGEIMGNGLDDDGNGYIDDACGWDFYSNNNSAEPKDSGDAHGVATAGLAAAAGDNAVGVAGLAPGCLILPAKIFHGEDFAGSSELAQAVRYAAGLTEPSRWRGADVISMSFGGGAASEVEDSAFADAAREGRQGRGAVLIASAGNGASDYQVFAQTVDPGTYYFEWRYSKDVYLTAGEDTCRLGLVLFPDGSIERFDAPAVPAGWNFSPEPGRGGWVIEDNPARAFSTGRYQARAVLARNSSYAICRSPVKVVTARSSVVFLYWISSEYGYDFIEFRAVKAGQAAPAFTAVDSGVYYTDPYVGYPANHPDVIAVGATSEFDYRSDFSQYGDDLDLVAPGAGGLVGIVTTDRTGGDGYGVSDYTFDFGGTSASAPIVSGAAALLLSRHPDLTPSQVRSLLVRTADKVGQVSYTGGEPGAGGRNTYYGYGRLNAGRMLGLARGRFTAGSGGELEAPAVPDLFCDPNSSVAVNAVADTFFLFGQWTSSPPAHATVFLPAAAGTTVTVHDDVTVTAVFDPMLSAMGTPLYWLAGYGLTQPTFDAAEQTDDDGDGHAAWQEWVTGTAPDDTQSVLRLCSFRRLEDGRCVAAWPSVEGRRYDLLRRNSPTGALNVAASALPATPPLNVHTTGPMPDASAFFSVRTGNPQ